MFEGRGRLGLEDSCINEDAVKTFRKRVWQNECLLSDADLENVTTSFFVILRNTPASS